MKKHLIAAAVAAAVAAPAMAQNVEIYGRLDAGFGDRSVKLGTTAETTTSSINFGAFTTQRLGFRGTEDLGGGLKASFLIETGLGGQGTSQQRTVAATSLGDRHMYLQLDGGFGSLLAGRTDSLYKTNIDTYDAGYANNFIGTVDTAFAATTAGGTAAGFTDGLYARSNSIRYTTPSLSGFRAAIGISKNTDETEGAVSKGQTNTGEEFALTYAAGPLSIGLAYQDVDTKETDGNPNNQLKGTALGVSYNFGVATVYGQYLDNQFKNKVGAGSKVDEEAYVIGVRVPVGAATIFASMTNGESKAGAVKDDVEAYQIGVKYDLSKRTYGYVAYGDQEVDRGANKNKADQFGIGLVHSF